jgi:hypothetical protein
MPTAVRNAAKATQEIGGDAGIRATQEVARTSKNLQALALPPGLA